ncbi:NR2E3 [Acanthosepion pharaonis]|uniref:NR2E3 n=1 Tax=Acanthosepion pharaonis TaxID=158019 RepID=A0A812CJI6_ACAPH|nr:NR2E3 [Sepia pharaonis]
MPNLSIFSNSSLATRNLVGCNRRGDHSTASCLFLFFSFLFLFFSFSFLFFSCLFLFFSFPFLFFSFLFFLLFLWPNTNHPQSFPYKVIPASAVNMSPSSYQPPFGMLTSGLVGPDQHFYVNSNGVENVYETAARLLFMSVKWARNIPSFLQQPFRDQAILLEESWSELFVLSTSQWSMPIDVASLLTANGWSLDAQHAEKTTFMMTQLRLLQDIIARCNELHVDATEYACLKAITLFRPGKI